MEDKNNISKKEKNNSNRKKKKIYENQSNKNLTKDNHIAISHSTKLNNLINILPLEKFSLNRDAKSNNLAILNSKYKKDLSEKFSEFLNKNKFKLSNNFDEKNSKKFLDKKDKCLERIIISDIIENDNPKESKDNNSYKVIRK